MLNKDIVQEKSKNMASQLAQALSGDDENAAADAIQEFSAAIAQMIETEFNAQRGASDVAALNGRGFAVLTSEERDWYEQFIQASHANNPKQAISNITAPLPITIIDRVIEDMKKSHPLLDEITFQNANGSTKLVMNGTQMMAKLGSWGAVASAIVEEVAGALRYIDMEVNKYTAFFLIPKDYVKFNFSFAPVWVDQYIRIVLSEVCANGLEYAIVAGNGKNKPIGMAYDIAHPVEGVYSEKSAIALTDWADYPALIANNLLVDANGDYRIVPEVLMVCNPKDYVKKLRPAQHTVTMAGVIDVISHQFPTRVIASAFVEEGYVKVGIAKNYFAAINGGKSGIIEYSDEAQFLDDNRVYTTRVYGNGQPIDNVSFINVNIANLNPAYVLIKELEAF